MNANGKLALGWLIVLALAQPAAASTFSFVPGHYYVNRYSSTGIHQYDESGNQVGFLSDPATAHTQHRVWTGQLDVCVFGVLALEQTW